MNFSIDPLTATLSVMAAYTAIVAWLFRVQSVAQTARDGVKRIEDARREDKLAYDAWITSIGKDAADYRAEISKLAESVDGLSKRIADRAEADQRFYTQRFDELEKRILDVKTNSTMAREIAAEGRARRKAAADDV